MELKSLTYTSRLAPGLGREVVEKIVAQARTNNPLDGVTGLLLFHDGRFMQLIEGAETAVDDMVEKLKRDPRHVDFTTIDCRIIPARAFPDWAMGYVEVDGSGNGREELGRALARALPEPARTLFSQLLGEEQPAR